MREVLRDVQKKPKQDFDSGPISAHAPLPPPWSVDETEACYIVRDATGQALAYVPFEEEPGRRRSS